MSQDVFSKRMSLDSWDRYSVAIEKPYVYEEATQAAIGYVLDKKAHLVYSPIDVFYALTEPEEISPALDISVTYDARWRGTEDNRYIMYTFGQPYILLVDTANKLTIQQGVKGIKTPLDSNVERCCLVRGWKHISDITIDQGLIAFYIKNGNLWSRAYVQTGTATYKWETAQQHSELGGGILDVKVRRTADYRLMIQVITAAGNKVALTDRVWPGQAFKPETISVSSSSDIEYTCSIKRTETVNVKTPTETFTMDIGILPHTGTSQRYADIIPELTRCDAFFGDTQDIVLRFNNDANIEGEILEHIGGKDANGKPIPITSITKVPFGVKVTCIGLEYFVGPLTLEYDGVGLFNIPLPGNPTATAVGPFTSTCELEGIIPQEPDPPIAQAVSILDGFTLNVTFDKKVLPTTGLIEGSIEAFSANFQAPIFSNGPISEYKLIATSLEVINDTTLQVKFNPDYFNNALPDPKMRLDYASTGCLFGEKGPVAPFSIEVDTSSLEPKPYPGCQESVVFGLKYSTGIRNVTQRKVDISSERIGPVNIESITYTASMTISGTIKP